MGQSTIYSKYYLKGKAVMRTLSFVPGLLVMLVFVQQAALGNPANIDLRRAVPDSVFLVTHSQHNPERDYQRKHYEAVWNTVQETQVLERMLAIITSRMEAGQLAQAQAMIDELREATAPIDMQQLVDCKEFVYAQQMQMTPMPTSQHLMLVRMTPEAAASMVQGMKNLFGMVEKYSGGDLPVAEQKIGNVVVTQLLLPDPLPLQPTVASMGDVFIFCTSMDLLETSLKLMNSTEGKSKFDDPRLTAALAQLPEAEDSLVFYDGRTQFAAMRQLGPFLQQMGGGDPNVERMVKILNIIMDDVAIIDYEVTVGYTEENLNRTASYGKLLPNTQGSTLRKIMDSGQPFDAWSQWVPAKSLSYSLGKGINLHAAYEGIMWLLENEIPESADALAQFEMIQQQVGVHLDKDILQAFSGEYVSVSLPSPTGSPQSVMALRCQKPDRIRELIQRGMKAIQQAPPVQSQQLKLVESKQLPGFQELSALGLMAFGIQPVIGFQDGWMFLGSSSSAVKTVLDTKAGKGDTMEQSEAFKRLNLEVQGAVDSISYTNTAESVRSIAQFLNQAAMMAPMVMAMAGADMEDPQLKPVQELIALLPDVAQIVEKFDFMEATVTVTQKGSDPDSYTKRSVMVIRPAE